MKWKLTAREAAQAIDVDPKYIYRWETEGTLPGLNSIYMLSQLYEIRIEDLLEDGNGEDIEDTD